MSAKSDVRYGEKDGTGQGARTVEEATGKWKCQEGGGQQAGVSMKVRTEAMPGRQCTADGWGCQEDGGQWASEIARGSLGDGEA